jgi:hypothetical protein
MSASLTITLLLLASVQDPFPQPGAEPVGVVLDETGRPVASARVALRWDAERSKPWSKSIEQVLQRTPLPSTLTNRDGEFALALTNDQRSLGSAGEGCFWLQVEHPGFQRWCEPLTNGLPGWLGSRVVLHTLTPGDRVEVRVLRAPRDARLEVRRLSERDPDPGVDAAVPASGVVAVDLSLVPTPKPTLSANELLPLGYRARLVAPDRTGAWRPFEPGREWDPGELRPRRVEPEPGPRRTDSVRISVTDEDGKPIERARVLLHDGAFFRSGPLPPPFATGVDGQVRIDGLRTNEVVLRVIAPGFFPAELPARADDERELTLQRARTVRLATLAGNDPVPFTRLHWQVERPAAQALALQARTIATDSLGRACLAVPAGARVFVWVSTSLRMARVELEVREVVERAEADILAWSIVLVPFDTRLATSRWSGKGTRGEGLTPDGRIPGAIGFLTQAIGPHSDFLQLETDGCVVLELRAADLDPKSRDGDAFVIDRRDALAERVLAVVDADGNKVAGAKVFLKRAAPGAADKPGYEGIEIRAAADGQLRVPLACSAKSLVALHPRYVRKELDLKALLAGGRDGPLQVRLERGVEISVRFVPEKCGVDTAKAIRGTISLGDELDGIEFRLGPRALTLEDVERQIELAPLEAAPAGSFEARVWLGGKLRKKTRVELVAGRPCVIEIE